MSMSLSVLTVLSLLPLAGIIACNTANASSTALPAAELDAPLASTHGQQTAVVAGGCFWGVQAVFQHVKGVTSAVSGYSGGSAQTANYARVCDGDTGHAESVKITFDPSQISYGQLLRVFFSVAHDPTELNRQGPDSGTQYRSVIFYENDEQKRIAEAYIAQLDRAKAFPRPHRHQSHAARGLLSRRGLPPELRRGPSEPALHHVQRCAEGGGPAQTVSRSFTPRMRRALDDEHAWPRWVIF